MSDLKMPEVNQLTLAGNMTRDPEISRLDGGLVVCKSAIAVNRRWKGEESTMFMEFSVWGKSADWMMDNTQKGSPVHLTGRLEINTWGEGAERKSRAQMSVNNIQCMSWPDSDREPPGGAGAVVYREDPDEVLF